MFILCTLGAAGYSELLNAEKRKGPKLRHDKYQYQRYRERGNMPGCELMQEIAATITLSCAVNFSNIKANAKSPRWVVQFKMHDVKS